jgi:hypothetical protein
VTVAIVIVPVIAQGVLVSNLREKQEGAIDKPGTEKIRLTLVKPASGNGGVRAWRTWLSSPTLNKKKLPLTLLPRFSLRKK